MKAPISPASLPADERALRSQLRQLLGTSEGFLHGTLVEVSRRCGNRTCRCAKDDKFMHPGLYLGQTRGRKTVTVFVPKRHEATVRDWLANFERATSLLEALNQQGRKRLAEAKAAHKASKTKAKANERKPITGAKPSTAPVPPLQDNTSPRQPPS